MPLPSPREEAAEAERDEQGRKRNCERVGRVSEEEHEALHQADLEEHEAEPDRQEVAQDAPALPRCAEHLASSEHDQRTQYEDRAQERQ